jgi:hypothetical protein
MGEDRRMGGVEKWKEEEGRRRVENIGKWRREESRMEGEKEIEELHRCC